MLAAIPSMCLAANCFRLRVQNGPEHASFTQAHFFEGLVTHEFLASSVSPSCRSELSHILSFLRLVECSMSHGGCKSVTLSAQPVNSLESCVLQFNATPLFLQSAAVLRLGMDCGNRAG